MLPPKYPCTFCGVAVPHPTAEYQIKTLRGKPCCSDLGCRRKREIAAGRLCCDKATSFRCVCESAYSCPVHAPDGHHIGSHE